MVGSLTATAITAIAMRGRLCDSAAVSLVQLQHNNLAVIDPGNLWCVLTVRTLYAVYKASGRFAIRIADSLSAVVCHIPTFQCSSANGAKGERRTAITVLNPACGEAIGEAPKASICDLGRAITPKLDLLNGGRLRRFRLTESRKGGLP